MISKTEHSSPKLKNWNITIKVTKDEEKIIKRKILDLEMRIGEYAKKKLLEA